MKAFYQELVSEQPLGAPDVCIDHGYITHTDISVAGGICTGQSVVVGDRSSPPDVCIDPGYVAHADRAVLTDVAVGVQLDIDGDSIMLGVPVEGPGRMTEFVHDQLEPAVGVAGEGVLGIQTVDVGKDGGISALVIGKMYILFLRQEAVDSDVDLDPHHGATLVTQMVTVLVGAGVGDPAAAFVAPGVFVGVNAGVVDQHTAFIAPVVPVFVNTDAVSHRCAAHQSNQQQTKGQYRNGSFHKITSFFRY